MVKVRTAAEHLRETVGSLYNADGTLNIDAVLDFIAWAWPEIRLHPFQEFFVEKALTVPNIFLEMARAGSKTWMNGLMAVVKQLIWPGRVVLITGPTYRQAKDLFSAAREFIETSPHLGEVVQTTRGKSGLTTEAAEQAEMHFVNGSRTLALPASGTKIHGKRASDLILTEFFEYPKDFYLRTVKPFKRGARVYQGMPKTEIFETTAGFEWQYAYEVRKLFVAKMQAGDPDYYLFSLDADDLTGLGYPGYENLLEELTDYYHGDEDKWKQQYKNFWPATTGSYYSLALLSRLELRRCEVEMYAAPDAAYVAGLDVGWSDKADAGDTAFAVWKIQAGRHPALVYIRAWHDSNTMRVSSEVAGLLKQFNISLLVVDAQGAGHSVVLSLRDEHGFTELGEKNVPGRQIVFRYPHGAPLLNEDHGIFKSAGINGTVSFPAFPESDEGRRPYDLVSIGHKQFANLRTKELPSGLYHFEQPAGQKKDIAMSILYGWHAVRMTTEVRSIPRKPGLILEQVEYDPFRL